MDDYREFRNETLLSILDERFATKNLKILEVGCGTGLTLQFLAQQSPEYRLFGMDLSQTMIQQAAQKALALANPPRLALGDADRLPFRDGFFDMVYATRFIHQFSHETKQKLWREFQRVTRKDGVVVAEFYARPYHSVRYYLGGAKGRAKEAYLSHFPTRQQVREIVAGHHDTYPLRVPGSRLLSGILGDGLVQRLTRTIGRASGGLLLDEYFVASRNG
jgi:ubiquinone/menaquinone biosynthesis C-methylase UbiE